MAKLPCFIFFGQSNMEGAGNLGQAGFDLAGNAARWFGLSNLGSGTNVAPGINYWMAQMPSTNHGAGEHAPISGTATSATVDTLVDTGTNFSNILPAQVVITGGTPAAAIGQLRNIGSISGNHTLVLTQPWAVTPSSSSTYTIYRAGTLNVATYKGSFKPLQSVASNSQTYTTGYEYCSWYSFPRQTPQQGTVGQIGPDLEATWQLQHAFDEDIWVIKLSIGSTYLSRYRGTLAPSSYFAETAWFRPGRHNSWHPAETDKQPPALNADWTVNDYSYGLFGMLIDKILIEKATAWVTANRPGDTLDVRGIFGMLGETDSTFAERAAIAGQNMQMVRDVMRSKIAAAGLSQTMGKNIPFVIGGVRDKGFWPYAGTINTQYKQLATDDPYSGYVNTDDLPNNDLTDQAHYSAAGQVTFGKRLYDEWVRVSKRQQDANRYPASRKTLGQLRTEVKRRYERNAVDNDATDERINQAINDSLREIYNTLGDSAWFLRRTESFTITSDYQTPFTLPRQVNRILAIENPINYGRTITFDHMGYTDEGRIKIRLLSDPGGTFDVHFVCLPTDLTDDSELAQIPNEYTELVVVMAAMRLAQTGGHQDQVAILGGEMQRLWRGAWRQAHIQDRRRAGPMVLKDRAQEPAPGSDWNRDMYY